MKPGNQKRRVEIHLDLHNYIGLQERLRPTVYTINQIN